MCGRYQAWVDDDELMRIIEREKKGNTARYFRQNEVFPGAVMPVLYGSYSTVRAHLSVWRYELSDSGRSSEVGETGENERDTKRTRKTFLINARSETAASKQLFKDSVMNMSSDDRRVAIITSGYYEWDSSVRCHIGEQCGCSDTDLEHDQYPEKLRFRSRCKPLILCGLETTAEADSHGITRRHVILTTAAIGTPAKIHHRMPLFLRREELIPWLYDTDFAIKKLNERVPCDLEVRRCDF